MAGAAVDDLLQNAHIVRFPLDIAEPDIFLNAVGHNWAISPRNRLDQKKINSPNFGVNQNVDGRKYRKQIAPLPALKISRNQLQLQHCCDCVSEVRPHTSPTFSSRCRKLSFSTEITKKDA